MSTHKGVFLDTILEFSLLLFFSFLLLEMDDFQPLLFQICAFKAESFTVSIAIAITEYILDIFYFHFYSIEIFPNFHFDFLFD